MPGLVGFLLLNILISSPVHALTIVDIEEISTVVWRQDTSECEWIEKIETKTITTYRDSYYANTAAAYPHYTPSISTSTQYSSYDDSGLVARSFSGFRNLCFPASEDEESEIPDYCTSPLILGGSGVGDSWSPLLFREWTTETIFYAFVLHNECDFCDGDNPEVSLVPEPSNFVLVATGWAVFFLRKRYFRP